MRSIKIQLDDILFELDLTGTKRKDSFLISFSGLLGLPSGVILNTQLRYEGGRRGLIDPILQQNVLDKYIPPEDHCKFWEEYRFKVSNIITDNLNNGTITISYIDRPIFIGKEEK